LNIFDLNNPLKPTPIPTKEGYWHKADTAFENRDIPLRLTMQSIDGPGRRFTIFYPGIEIVLFV
jgi:hypothetical protein